MKISDVIDDLKKDLEASGDQFVRSFRIETETEVSERRMLHPDRRMYASPKRFMTLKEFRAWVKKQKQESKE